jgi:short-subunit dehydrogenase
MSESSTRKSLLIIGASRDLGYALTEEYLRLGWHVVATGRAGSVKRLQGLMSKGAGHLEVQTVDMNLPPQVAALHARLRSRQFDLLIGNAGVKNADHETVASRASRGCNIWTIWVAPCRGEVQVGADRYESTKVMNSRRNSSDLSVPLLAASCTTPAAAAAITWTTIH